MIVKEVLKKLIEKKNDEECLINIQYTKVKMNPKLLKRKYEEEQFKKYKIIKEKYSEII